MQQVAAVIKVAMPPYQATIYSWVKETGTLRNDPDTHVAGKIFRDYAPLNNKCMELRKVGSTLSCASYQNRVVIAKTVIHFSLE